MRRPATPCWLQVHPRPPTVLVAASLLQVEAVVQVAQWSSVLVQALAARLVMSSLLRASPVAHLLAATCRSRLATQKQAQVALFVWLQAAARVLQVAMCHFRVVVVPHLAVLSLLHQLIWVLLVPVGHSPSPRVRPQAATQVL